MPAPALTLVVFSVPAPVYWPYFLGAAILAIGLPVILKNELPQAHGLDKVMPFGRLFYAIPIAVFAGEHFTIARLMAPGVPSWIPAHLFWIYFVGVALVAAAVSIVVKKYGQVAATLFGIMMCLFVVLLHIPRVVANPRDRISWAVALRELAFAGGAFAFASTQSKTRRSSNAAPSLLTLARYLVATTALFFGVEHFLHPDFAPGVPLAKLTPAWIPVPLFWGYLTGAVLLISGACLLINKKPRLAATYLGLTILLIVLVIYLPILISIPSDIGNGLNYFADTLMFAGTILLLADALPKEAAPHA
jgi:uncharacterized membrane protein